MKSEEVAQLVIDPKYGFGEAGNEELGIPGNATLVYVIRLNSFQKVLIPPLPSLVPRLLPPSAQRMTFDPHDR